MVITVNLVGYISELSGNTDNRFALGEGASAADLLERIRVDDRIAFAVLVNGTRVMPGNYRSFQLADGDTVALVPLVDGG